MPLFNYHYLVDRGFPAKITYRARRCCEYGISYCVSQRIYHSDTRHM